MIEVFNHLLSSGEMVKFSIWKRQIQGKTYFYARVAETDLPFYKNLPAHAQETYFGARVSYGKNHPVFYSSYLSLRADLLTYYGSKWALEKVS